MLIRARIKVFVKGGGVPPLKWQHTRVKIPNGHQNNFLCAKRDLNDFEILSKVVIVNINQYRMAFFCGLQ